MISLANFKQYFEQNEAEFLRLVQEGQAPKTLFIGCSDSRVIPELLTSSKPGDLFVVRNIGNLVPVYQVDNGYLGVTSAIEFAVEVLGIKEIIVCGHSHCGAIRALYQAPPGTTPNINKWLELAQNAKIETTELTEEILRQTEKNSVKIQLERLLEYPCIKDKIANNQVHLHGWHYTIEKGKIQSYDAVKDTFEDL